MKNEKLKWIKRLTWFFIIGLFISGATAIPLQTELDAIVKFLGGVDSAHASGFAFWILKVREALNDTYAAYPFIAYGTGLARVRAFRCHRSSRSSWRVA